MNYSFKIHKSITDSIWYYVEPDEEEYSTLSNFTSSDWTSEKIQSIIELTENNINLPNEEENNPYIWGNEDLHVFVNELGVLLIDNMAVRAGVETVKPLELTYEEFLKFLEDFKQFVEENL